MTMFYNNRDTIISILDYFNINYPENINNFKLPCDWNEEELDYFMKAMPYNVNCNDCVFKDNLQFWYSTALLSVKDQCINRPSNYTKIPWQFVLRNPLLRKSKYLVKIGENLFASNNHKFNDNFLEFEKYQNLTAENLLMIFNSAKANHIVLNRDSYNFLTKHLDILNLPSHKRLLDAYYKMLTSLNLYDCISSDKLLKLPVCYLEKWIRTARIHDILNFVDNNQEKLQKANKQVNELVLSMLTNKLIRKRDKIEEKKTLV